MEEVITEVCKRFSVSEDIQRFVIQRFHIDILTPDSSINDNEIVYNSYNEPIGVVFKGLGMNVDLEQEFGEVIDIVCSRRKNKKLTASFRIGNILEVRDSDVFFAKTTDEHYTVFTKLNFIFNFQK